MKKTGRPKKEPDEVRESVTAALLPEIVSMLEEIKDIEDRTRSYLVEKFIARGLAAYKRDGLLNEPKEPPQLQLLPETKQQKRRTG